MIRLKCKKCRRDWYTSSVNTSDKIVCGTCGGELKEVNMYGLEKKKSSSKKRNKSIN